MIKAIDTAVDILRGEGWSYADIQHALYEASVELSEFLENEPKDD